MPKKKKKNRKPRVKGVITSIESVSYFTVDGDEVVRIGPKTRIQGVAVNPTGLIVGQQVSCVGDRNKDKLFTADKINVESATGPEPVEPEEDEEPVSPITPTPDIEPEPQPEPPAPDSGEQVDDSPVVEEEQVEEEQQESGR